MKYICTVFLAVTLVLPATLTPHNTTQAIAKHQPSATSQNQALHGCSATIPRLANRDVCVAEAVEGVAKGETFGKVSPLDDDAGEVLTTTQYLP